MGCRGSHIFYTVGSQMAVMSALLAGRALLLRKIPGAIVQLEGLDKLKKCNDFIGNQTRDLSSCSTVPQPTVLPYALHL
jgi:hypothetical protein